MLSERAIEVQNKLVHVLYRLPAKPSIMSYTRNLLKYLRISRYGKDLRVIRNLYWKQAAAIRICNHVGEYVEIKKGCKTRMCDVT